MAKDKNQNAQISIKDVNEDNITEQLQNANRFSKEIVEMAKKSKDEKEQKRQAEEFERISDKATYFNLRFCLFAKMYKEAKKAADKLREESQALLLKVEAGELTASQYDDELEKLAKEISKKVDEVSSAQRKDRDELRHKFPNGDWWTWDNFFQQATAAIRRMARQAEERLKILQEA